MGKLSRRKGEKAMREVVNIIKDHGFDDAEKRSQYRGGVQDGTDVWFWVMDCEVKHRKRLDVHGAYKQAVVDAGAGQHPVAVTRRHGDGQWLATMDLHEWLELVADARRWRERA